jgi:selenocysteine lyase/cysteine desulfurase
VNEIRQRYTIRWCGRFAQHHRIAAAAFGDSPPLSRDYEHRDMRRADETMNGGNDVMTSDGMTSIDWERYRSEFPVAQRFIYFNHAAVSPMSTRVRRAMDVLSDDLLTGGMMCGDRVFERIEEIRTTAARFIGASPEEIAFTKNTNQGVLIASQGIRWRDGDNVVLPSIEFPTNVYPWMALRDRGVTLKMVEPERGRVSAEMLAEACDERTRAVTVSAVQFSSGYRIDLAALGRYCRAHGILLHVDAIQHLGALRCDLGTLEIDFLSAGGHKWLMSVPGAGIFYIRKELLDEIDVWNPGWNGVVDALDFLDYNFTYRDDAKRFEEATSNMHGIYALGASIERFLEIGMEGVEHRILSITDTLAAGLIERGYTITSPRGGKERSGILCFKHADIPSEEIMERLQAGKIVAGLREGAVRLSPHLYNSEEEIGRFFSVLESKGG